MHYFAQNLNNQGYDFYHFETIDSTMDEARRLIDKVAISKKIVLLADNQINGRGKIGNSWISPSGNIYLTIIYSLNQSRDLSSFSLVAGLALLELILLNTKKDFEIKIKWPNDLYINQRKAAGILPETYKENLILGIGINWLIAPESFSKINDLVNLDKLNFIYHLIINLEKKLNNYLTYGLEYYQNRINNYLYQKGQNHILEINYKGHLLYKDI